MLAVILWSTLTLIFIHRLMVILKYNLPQSLILQKINLDFSINILGKRTFSGPEVLLPVSFNFRPILQLLVWIIELWFLTLFYSAFGTSVTAHLAAAITAAGIMFMLREKDKPFLESLQLVPMKEESDVEDYTIPPFPTRPAFNPSYT